MTEHLLIVDDDKEICALLSQFMTQHGYRISVTHEGRTMMQILDSARIDLVVLDVMLPGESGLSLCRRVRSSSSIPIIMLTAVGSETDRSIEVQISRLRRKLKIEPGGPDLIKTVRGGGYVFAANVAAVEAGA
jgi:two-component system OmpR family response regulator